MFRSFYLFDLNVELQIVTILARLQLNVLLNGELWCLAISPVPRSECIAGLVQSREPFLGRIDQLEATLLHDLLATSIGELLGRRSQELVSDCGQQLLHIHVFIDICQILDWRSNR